MTADPIVDTWSSVATHDQTIRVLPDGCRDVIFRQGHNAKGRWYISPLHSTVHDVQAETGAFFQGYRIKAGTGFDASTVLGLLKDCAPVYDRVHACLMRATVKDGLVESVLDTLRENPQEVASVANQHGVSIRTLQRRTRRQTGQSPEYWKRLSRVRRSAALIADGLAFADVAALCGFCDQAHMTREFRAWFGMTPLQSSKSSLGQRVKTDGGF